MISILRVRPLFLRGRLTIFLIRNSLTAASILAALGASPTLADAPKPDSGKFTLLVQGKSVGTDTFRLLPDGCDADITAVFAGDRTVQFHQSISFKKGRMAKFTTDAGSNGTISVTLAGSKSSLRVTDKPETIQKLPEVVYPYGDRSPHLFAFLVGAYDIAKSGEQKFDVVFTEAVGPGGVIVIPVTMKAPESSTKSVAGKSVDLLRFRFTLNTPKEIISMEIVTDKVRHVLLWNVPSQKYTAVRDGFQELAR